LEPTKKLAKQTRKQTNKTQLGKSQQQQESSTTQGKNKKINRRVYIYFLLPFFFPPPPPLSIQLTRSSKSSPPFSLSLLFFLEAAAFAGTATAEVVAEGVEVVLSSLSELGEATALAASVSASSLPSASASALALAFKVWKRFFAKELMSNVWNAKRQNKLNKIQAELVSIRRETNQPAKDYLLIN
jgi:hypothetical protein